MSVACSGGDGESAGGASESDASGSESAASDSTPTGASESSASETVGTTDDTDSSAGGSASTAGGTDSTTSSSDSSDSSTESTTGGTESTTGGTESTTGDSESTTGDTDTTGGLAEYEVDVLLSAEVLLSSADGDALDVTCGLRKDGAPYAGEYTALVSVSPGDDVIADGEGKFEFATFGVWTVTCDVDVDGTMVSAERDVGVLNDAITPELALLARGLGQARYGLFHMLRADGQEDQELIDAAGDLEASLALLDPANLAGVDDSLIPVAFGYPTPAELDQLGITATADDPAMGGALDDVSLALLEVQTTLAMIDPLSAVQDDLDALEAVTGELQAAVDAYEALDLTAHGYLANSTKLADLSRDAIAPTMQAVAQWTYTYVQDQSGLYGAPYKPGVWLEDADDGLDPRFGFVSLAVGFVNTSNIQVQMMNKMYGDAFKALDRMINNLILLKVIDYFYDPDAVAPEIFTPYASASLAFALEGYDAKFGGSGFHDDPSFNHFLIIGDGWQDTAENAMNACGIKPGDSHPKIYKKVEGCVQQVLDLAESSVAYGTQVDKPGQLDAYDVHIGPFPEACESFVPVPIGIIPVNANTGSGPLLTLNCIDN